MTTFVESSEAFHFCAIVAKDIRRAEACVDIIIAEKSPPYVEIL